MPHRIVLALVAICCTVLPCRAERNLVPVKTTDFTFAVWSDIHIAVRDFETENPADAVLVRCPHVLSFIAAYDPKPEFLLITGDMCTGSWQADEDMPWDSPWGVVPENHVNIAASAFTLQNWADTSGVPIVPVVGNHEATYYSRIGHPEVPAGVDWDPHAVARKYWRKYWPSLASGNKEFFSSDFHSVRILAMSNNVDTTRVHELQTRSCYPGSNPPALSQYPEGVGGQPNPDYSGFSTPASRQWTWAVDQVANSPQVWTIAAMHRAVYSTIEASYNTRPNIFSARHGIMADMTDAGLKLVFHGDTHIGSVVGPVNNNAVDPDGAYYVTLHQQFAPRDIDETVVPANSVLYPPEGKWGTVQTGAHFAICHVYGKRIHMKIYYTSVTGSGGYDVIVEPITLVFEMGVRQ